MERNCCTIITHLHLCTAGYCMCTKRCIFMSKEFRESRRLPRNSLLRQLSRSADVMSAIRKGPLRLSTRTPRALVHHKSTLLGRDQICTMHRLFPHSQGSRKSISAGRIHTHSNVTGEKESGPSLPYQVARHRMATGLDK